MFQVASGKESHIWKMLFRARYHACQSKTPAVFYFSPGGVGSVKAYTLPIVCCPSSTTPQQKSQPQSLASRNKKKTMQWKYSIVALGVGVTEKNVSVVQRWIQLALMNIIYLSMHAQYILMITKYLLLNRLIAARTWFNAVFNNNEYI